jgi:hypothetical protein
MTFELAAVMAVGSFRRRARFVNAAAAQQKRHQTARAKPVGFAPYLRLD